MYLTCKKQLRHLKRLDRVFDAKPHACSQCWLKLKLEIANLNCKNPVRKRSAWRFLAWPRAIAEKKLIGRYVAKASLRHVTMERQCLRWWMTARPCIHPLQTVVKFLSNCCKIQIKTERSFTSVQINFTHTHTHSCARSLALLPTRRENNHQSNLSGVESLPFMLTTRHDCRAYVVLRRLVSNQLSGIPYIATKVRTQAK